MKYLRILDAFSITSYAGLSIWLLIRSAETFQSHPNPGFFIYIPLILILAYLAADLLSGVVHFLADNFGSANTFILGPALVHPFRDHHVDPEGITRHGFLETNGNNCLICVPILLGMHYAYDSLRPGWAFIMALAVNATLFFIFLTNQFHKWAHQTFPPAAVRTLQRMGMILSPSHHSVHHRAPHLRNYCITSGWLNPLLDRSGVLTAILRISGKLSESTENQLEQTEDSRRRFNA